jgi:hypothetical protein
LLLGQLLEVESSSAVMRTLLSDEVPDLSASTCDIPSVAFNGINHSSSPEEEPGGRETCCELSKISGLSSQDGTCDADVKDHRTVRVDADESKDGQPFATGMNLVVMPKNESHFLGSDRDKFQDDVDALSSDDEELIKQFLRFKPSSDHRHSMRKMSR